MIKKKSIEHWKVTTFYSSDKETNNNGIMLAENKLKLRVSEISRKQHNSSKEKKFKEDQNEQIQIILSSDMMKGKNCDASIEKQLKKNTFNSWINIKSEKYSNDSSEKCSYNKKK